MSDPISGIAPDVIAALRNAVTGAKNEYSQKTYFSIEESKEDAAREVGLSKEGELWFIRTKDTATIDDIKKVLKCDVVEGPSKNGEKPTDDRLDLDEYLQYLAQF
jgi:hypothetical protein